MNYLNPVAFAPDTSSWKPDPAYAAILQQEKLRDYRKLMEDQYAMQEIERAKQQLALEESRKDVPVKDLKRESDKQGYLGSIPYAQEKAATGSQSEIATNKYNQFEKGPEGIAAKRADWREQLDKAGRTRMEHESKMLVDTLEGGRRYGPEWTRKRVEELRKQKYNVPDEILDPQKASVMYEGLLDNLKWAEDQRKEEFQNTLNMKRDAANNAAAMERARLAAETSRANAATRSSGGGGSKREPIFKKPQEALTYATVKLSDPRLPEIEREMYTRMQEDAVAGVVDAEQKGQFYYQQAMRTLANPDKYNEEDVDRAQAVINKLRKDKLEGVRRSKSATPQSGQARAGDDLANQAREAIRQGKDPEAVKQRYKQMTGKILE